MDWLFPGSLDLSRVQFQCDTIMHSLHNFTLLQAAFRKAGVIRVSVAALSGPDIITQVCSEHTCVRNSRTT